MQVARGSVASDADGSRRATVMFPQSTTATMVFPNGAVGHINVSRLDPRKVRELTIVGDRKMAVYDDTDPEMPVRIYDRGVDRDLPTTAGALDEGFGLHQLSLRTGDVHAPQIAGREPLRVEIEDFVTAVVTGAVPRSSGIVGRDVVAVLEAAERSSALGGEPASPERRLSDDPPVRLAS